MVWWRWPDRVNSSPSHGLRVERAVSPDAQSQGTIGARSLEQAALTLPQTKKWYVW